MKGKKLFSLLLVISLAACMSAVNVLSVSAEPQPVVDDPEYVRIWGVVYNTENMLEYLGLEKLEGKDKYKDGRVVKYGMGDDVTTYETAGDTVEFKKAGEYTFKIYLKAEDDGEDTFEVEKTVKVNDGVTPSAEDEEYNKTSVSYKMDADGLAAYQDKVTENAANLATQSYTNDAESYDNSFTVPSMRDLVVSKDFDYDSLQKVVHYCTPTSSSYSTGSSVTTSDATFTVSEVGEYGFYVLFEDVFGNKMTTDGLVQGAGGWYKADDDGNAIGATPVIPVFTFSVTRVAKPQIAVKSVQEDAFVDLSYEISAFTITADNYSSVYELYYLPKTAKVEKGNNDADYINAVKTNAAVVDVTDKLDKDSLTFTPGKENEGGYYYLWTRITDSNNLSTEAMSLPIHCAGEYKTVETDPMFWQNNLTSVILLGVAGLCFIAILVLLFVKPKESAKVELEGADNAKAAPEKGKKK